MSERTFTCAGCGVSCTVPVTRGRPKTLCESCAASRKDARQQAHRGHRNAKQTPNTVCQRCGGPLPEGTRADRKWCSRACQSWVNRRESGQVSQNTGHCSSCLKPLLGQHVHAKVCRSTKCRTWAARHPGVPHPSTQPRTCKQCGASIDHLNGKAKFCSKNCTSMWLYEQDPERHKARSKAWQSSPEGRAYRKATRRRTPSGGSSGRGRVASATQSGTRGTGSSGPPRTPRLWPRWAACGEPGCGRTRTASGCPSGSGGASSTDLKAVVSTAASRPMSSTWITWSRWPRVDGMPRPMWWSLVGGATSESTPCF
jgi:hypothetical protein